MSILLDNSSNVLVQGITGKEGSKATKQMLDYGTNVVCGVTPGKGGQFVENIPVYDTVKEAVENHPQINTSVLYVPPLAVLDSSFEAIDNSVKLLVIVTETVPLHDVSKILTYAKNNDVTIVGPSSIGIISPGKAKVGSIGGEENIQYQKGTLGVISKSGGMCSETSMLLKNAGYGVSTVVGIGGDVISGFSYTDALRLFEKDDDTEAVVIIGEVGGFLEQEAAKLIQNDFSKPVIAFIAGKFASQLPGVSLGHAGAILEGKKTSQEEKVRVLRKSGVHIANVHHEIVEILNNIFTKNGMEN